MNGLTYGQLINGMKVAGITIDRKVLADMAVKTAGFAQIAEKARAAAPPQVKTSKKPREELMNS